MNKKLQRRLRQAEAERDEAIAKLMGIAEILTATGIVNDFDDPVKQAHEIADYCRGHHPGAVGDGDGRGEGEGESDGD